MLGLAALLILACSVFAAGDEGANQFSLKPEFNGPYEKRDRIDVNLGNSPEAFVRAAYGQIFGRSPDENELRGWVDKLRQSARLRRIDVVRALLKEAARSDAPLDYSDPWKQEVDLADAKAPRKKTKRDIGAVMMFFFNCPGGVNGGMDWANTHAPGMNIPSPILAFGTEKAGYYDPPSNPGFWTRELADAKYAGLDFVLLNTYGPDLSKKEWATLTPALKTIPDPIKISLFDDTWAWGRPYFGDFWKHKPDLNQTEQAAKTLYEVKWKPFFQVVTDQYRYKVKGRPLIYFYNAGTLQPRNKSAAVLKRMKEMFKADFGMEPFVVVDRAYFEDPAMKTVADSEFTWFTFDLPGKRSRSEMNGIVFDHAMVRWDPYGRDQHAPSESDLLVKGPEILDRVLHDSMDADILVLATWNDLGEGTGFNRNYDYYYKGQWLPPDYFMQRIRASQFSGAPN
jgi:hypothetical protein